MARFVKLVEWTVTGQRSLEHKLECKASYQKSRYVLSTRAITFSDFRPGPQNCPGAAPAAAGPAALCAGQRARGNEPTRPVAPRVTALHSDATRIRWPARLRKAGRRPLTRSRVAQLERKCDSNDSERATGEEAAASDHLPSQNVPVSGQQAHQLP